MSSLHAQVTMEDLNVAVLLQCQSVPAGPLLELGSAIFLCQEDPCTAFANACEQLLGGLEITDMEDRQLQLYISCSHQTYSDRHYLLFL